MAKNYRDHLAETLTDASMHGVDVTKLSEEDTRILLAVAAERQYQYENRSTARKVADAASTAYGWFEMAFAVLLVVGVVIGIGYAIVSSLAG
ncbi:MAG: hypothetical protein IJ087_22055 [Eggerthellaceae bacterium]|nr:hypothetical protein [Eggerthellaceae bacterium]